MQQGIEVLVRASADSKAVRSQARRTPVCSALHRADLKARVPVTQRLMNVKIPASIVQAIDTIATHVHASKTELVLALLNEGLSSEIAEKRLAGRVLP